MNRRHFLATGSAALAAGCSKPATEPRFPISLAQYSLHKRILQLDGAEPLDPLEFPAVARSFEIGIVEYVSMLWRDTWLDQGMPWVKQLRTRADDAGVEGFLLMIDREPPLGATAADERATAVDAHARYFEVAAELGCGTIRVDPKHTADTPDEAFKHLAEGVRALCERADAAEIDVLIENEAGFGADPEWLVRLVEAIDHPRFGLLPDFGNFIVAEDDWRDPVAGTRKMMPHARAVSAKSFGFKEGSRVSVDPRPNSPHDLDFDALIGVVLAADYRGPIGIEYEGPFPEMDGIAQTLRVLRELQ